MDIREYSTGGKHNRFDMTKQDDFVYDKKTDTYRCPADQIFKKSVDSEIYLRPTARSNGATLQYSYNAAGNKTQLITT